MYGTFVEAAAAHVPVVYVRHYNFLDETSLIDYLSRFGGAVELAPDALARGVTGREPWSRCSLGQPGGAGSTLDGSRGGSQIAGGMAVAALSATLSILSPLIRHRAVFCVMPSYLL